MSRNWEDTKGVIFDQAHDLINDYVANKRGIWMFDDEVWSNELEDMDQANHIELHGHFLFVAFKEIFLGMLSENKASLIEEILERNERFKNKS